MKDFAVRISCRFTSVKILSVKCRDIIRASEIMSVILVVVAITIAEAGVIDNSSLVL